MEQTLIDFNSHEEERKLFFDKWQGRPREEIEAELEEFKALHFNCSRKTPWMAHVWQKGIRWCNEILQKKQNEKC